MAVHHVIELYYCSDRCMDGIDIAVHDGINVCNRVMLTIKQTK